MTDEPAQTESPRRKEKPALHPFRRAVLRGMGVVMPPLLTVVLFIWAWSMIDGYVLQPIESSVNFVIRVNIQNVYDGIPKNVSADDIYVLHDGQTQNVVQLLGRVPVRSNLQAQVRSKGAQLAYFRSGATNFVPLSNDKWIPVEVLEAVQSDPGVVQLSTATPEQVYQRFVQIVHLPRWKVIPVFLLFFVGILYFIGKFLAFGVGRFVWNAVETLIRQLPVIRNVYSSVKQVTDFVFSEQEVQFNRVVAVQYPRKGMWSIGFVTGESMLDIRYAANEPVLTVLMPTSPMPATGFTITVRKSETIDLDISIDQAIQFVVSCGVVVPTHQQSPSHADTSARLTSTVQRLARPSPNGQARGVGDASGERSSIAPTEPAAGASLPPGPQPGTADPQAGDVDETGQLP